MGPLFVLIFWCIVAVTLACIYTFLHFLGEKYPFAALLKKVFLGFILAMTIPFCLLALFGIARYAFGL